MKHEIAFQAGLPLHTERNGGNLGFEDTLWQTADKLRSNLDASDYKTIVLGLIFLRSLSFPTGQGSPPSNHSKANRQTQHHLVIPQSARWEYLEANSRDPQVGALLDLAMHSIEEDNPSLRGALPAVFARTPLEKARLGEIVKLVGTLQQAHINNGATDILGRVYEYFLGQFARAEGARGGQFYTPRCIVRLLVEMLAPYKGKVYDPCCGSGGMFVQSYDFVTAHGGKFKDISIFGQESNPSTLTSDVNSGHQTFHAASSPA